MNIFPSGCKGEREKEKTRVCREPGFQVGLTYIILKHPPPTFTHKHPHTHTHLHFLHIQNGGDTQESSKASLKRQPKAGLAPILVSPVQTQGKKVWGAGGGREKLFPSSFPSTRKAQENKSLYTQRKVGASQKLVTPW